MAASSRLSRIIACCAGAAALIGVLLSPVACAEPVRTDNGLVEGVEENGVLVFKGIPFAAARSASFAGANPGPLSLGRALGAPIAFRRSACSLAPIPRTRRPNP